MSVAPEPGSPEVKIFKDWLTQRYHAPSDDVDQPVDPRRWRYGGGSDDNPCPRTAPPAARADDVRNVAEVIVTTPEGELLGVVRRPTDGPVTPRLLRI